MNGANMIAGATISNPTALAKADPARAFEPSGIDEAVKLANLLGLSGLLGKDLKTPEQVFTVIATGRELGLTAMQSLRSIHIINGKPTLSADLVAALVKSRPEVCEYFRLVDSNASQAVYETKRRGEPSPTTMTFSIEDAKRAQITGNPNWTKYPAAMLRARCITALARAVYPDLVMGIYDPDELGYMVTPNVPPSEMTGEVVREVPKPPESEPVASDPAVFDSFCKRIDEAESAKALDTIAKDAVKAGKSGALSKPLYASIGSAIANKRRVLTEPAAPPDAPQEREPGEEG